MGATQNSSPTFADVLRRFRVAAGLSQEALAERASLSTRAISDLERGARRAPYRETIRLLADGLGLNEEGREALEAAVDRGRGSRHTLEPLADNVTLPVSPTALFGREKEVATVRNEFLMGRTRLVTLTGPPGIGKTQLALEVARGLASQRPDGVFVVGLAPLTDPRTVGTSILQALGLAEIGERPATDRLKDVLRPKRALLLLDNFEHVIDAAPLISELLGAAPDLAVLATSRIALRLRGEHEFPVPPLAIPVEWGEGQHAYALKTVSTSAAVALFLERARSVKPGFSLTNENAYAVSEICRRLDGLPLAIELAAARCKVLSPDAVLHRLEHGLDVLVGGARDAPARHRTLRSAISWSFNLLTPVERVFFRRLGIFAGGCNLEAAGRVGAFGIEVDALDVMSALVDQSLIQVADRPGGESRFMMLETLREFALEQLEAAGERATVRQRHAAEVLNVALEAERYLNGSERGEWLRRLNDEQDNIRSALAWARDQSDPTLGLALLGALWLWFQRRLLVEGRRWADELLAHPGASKPTESRAKALFVAGHFSWLQGDVSAMRTRLGEAVEIQRQLGDMAGLGRSLPFLGLAAEDPNLARQLAEEGVQYCRQVGNSWSLALALLNLGRTEATWGNDNAARAPLDEAARLFDALNDRWLHALTLSSIGAISYRDGRFDEATAAFVNALSCFQAVEDRRNTAQAMTNLGFAHLASGDQKTAREHFATSLAFGWEHGDRFNTPACLRGVAAADLAATDRDLVEVTRLLAAADTLTGTTGAARWPAERLGGPIPVDSIKAALGQETFEDAWASGAALTAEEAVAAASPSSRTRN